MRAAPAQPSDQRYAGALRRGVLVNAIGLFAKLGAPLLVVTVTRLFGPEIAGVFLLTQLVSEIARSAALAGYADAVTIFGSRARAASEGEDRVYAVIATALRPAFAVTLALAGVALVGAEPIARLFPELHGLPTAIRYAGAALPFLALGQIATAATKIELRMEYDVAVWGFGRPMGLLVASVVAWALGGGLAELMIGYLVVHVVLGAAGAVAFARVLRPRRALAACLRASRAPGLHRFAIPQNLNMTFNRFQARMDVLALGMLGYSSATIAFYVTGALIASSLQEVRMIFSSALAPVVGRFHGAGAQHELEELLARVSRWTTSLVVPLCAVALIWRAEILVLVDASYTHDSGFVALLLLGALINCSLGLGGNYLVFMGHSAFNLFNSLLVAGLSAALSFALIPEHGLLGAAAASLGASLAVAIAQLVEVRLLEGIRLLWRRVYKPYVGLLALCALFALTWDPARLGGPMVLTAASIAAFAVYGAVLAVLRHEEVMAYLRQHRPARATPATTPALPEDDSSPS